MNDVHIVGFVNALLQPIDCLSFELTNGLVLEQVVEYEYFPMFVLHVDV